MRIPGRQLAVLVTLGAALEVFGPVAGAPLAGAAASGGPPAPGTTVVCVGSIGYGEEETTFGGTWGFSGSATCVTTTGSSFPLTFEGTGGGFSDGLSQCVGPVWLPGLFPGQQGHGTQINFIGPPFGSNLDLVWAGPTALRGLTNIPLVGDPSPAMTGLLYSGSGATVGTATAVWASPTCSSGGGGESFFINASVQGALVMEFKVPSS
jgi:hypothetical protein